MCFEMCGAEAQVTIHAQLEDYLHLIDTESVFLVAYL